MPSCVTRQNSASSPVVSDCGGGGGISNMTTGTSGGPMLGMPQAPINGNNSMMGSMQNSTSPQQQPSPSTAVNNNSNQMMSNPEATQQFCLRWNSYPATVATQLAALRAAEDFVDVTLACDGRQLRAHKLVLSACSPYFMQLFKSTPCKHPVIFLKDVGFRQLVALLEFMYAGEVNVSQAELPALLKTAEALQVRGLADTTPNNNFPSPPKPGFPSFSPGLDQNTMPVSQNTQNQGDTMDPTSGNIYSAQNVSNSASCDATSNACSNNSTMKRSQNSPNEKNDDEDESNDDNDSQEFDMGCMEDAAKQDGYFNDAESLSQQFDGTGEEFGQTIGDTSSFDLSQGDLADELLTGENHTDEESEDVEDDENSLECGKNLSGFSNDGSFGQTLDLGGTPNGVVSGNSAGSSMNASGLAGLDQGNPLLKSEGGMPNSIVPPPLPGIGGGRGRNRLARSMFPMQSNYHGSQQCPYCNKNLSNVGNWRKHVLTMHFAREKLFKCEMCPSSFRTTEYLQKHYVRVHNFPQKMTRKKIPVKQE